MFETRHYNKLAQFWRDDGCLHCHEPAVIDVYNDFVKLLKEDNPRFNEGKFREASGVDAKGRSVL